MRANTNPQPNQIGIKTFDGVTFVYIDDIICLETLHGHTLVFLVNREKPIKSTVPLSGFKKHLTENFIETHRSYIINRKYIGHLEKNKRTLRLTNNHVVKVAGVRLPEILKSVILIE